MSIVIVSRTLRSAYERACSRQCPPIKYLQRVCTCIRSRFSISSLEGKSSRVRDSGVVPSRKTETLRSLTLFHCSPSDFRPRITPWNRSKSPPSSFSSFSSFSSSLLASSSRTERPRRCSFSRVCRVIAVLCPWEFWIPRRPLSRLFISKGQFSEIKSSRNPAPALLFLCVIPRNSSVYLTFISTSSIALYTLLSRYAGKDFSLFHNHAHECTSRYMRVAI